MYEPHTALTTPDDSQPIWRYIDIEKLILLLSKGRLYLPRTDKLGDPWEGHYAATYLLSRFPEDRHKGALLRAVRRQQLDCNDNYISCWHKNKDESTAM